MQGVEYGVGRFLDEPYEAAKARVIEALKVEGFGVLTEIDVKA
ncbi:MAG: ABC transporter ATP-binding protein, partial [Thermoleophilia bacterium]|nr:ABC transporter ATP-binding protein [Thermoleophilia bacterium]